MRLNADRLIGAIAARQAGCVTFGQLISAGLARSVIEHRVRSGRLIRRFRGVYVVGHEAPIELQEEWAASLALGETSCLVRGSCAYVRRLIAAPPSIPEICVPEKERKPRPGVRILPPNGLEAAEIEFVRGLRVTAIPVLLLDLCSDGETRYAQGLLNEARVKRQLSDGEIEAFLEAPADGGGAAGFTPSSTDGSEEECPAPRPSGSCGG